MKISRRKAVNMMAVMAALAADCNPAAVAQAVSTAPSNAVDVDDYWSNFYETSSFSKGAQKSDTLPEPDRETKYLYAAESGKPLMWADTIDWKTTLPALQGDVLVKVAISQYRPSKGDVSLDTSHLRVDAAQPFDLMDVVAPLSWAAIASITPSTAVSKIPTLDQIGLKAAATQPSGISQITLPSGVGHFAVNVTRPQSTKISEIISAASVTISAALSILNVPAISGPAARAFTTLIGKWQSHSTIIMNGYLTPVVATSKAPEPLPWTPMALPSGYMVMVPKKHQEELGEQLNNNSLQMLNGFLVSKTAGAGDDLTTLASQVIPGVSYVTLRVYTSLAPAGGCGAKVDSSQQTK